MMDDPAQGAPAEPLPTPEPATQVVAPEPTPTSVESAPVVQEVASAESASVIPQESQSAQQAPAVQSSQSVPSSKWSVADRARAVAKRVGRKETRLAKVVELAKVKGRITNDNVEKLLHVSDATASRYGTILVQRGLLKRQGKGRGANYILPY